VYKIIKKTKKTKFCKRCGRILTDKKSIVRGYGPVCNTKRFVLEKLKLEK